MNWIFTKILSWAVGSALANSDRVRVAIATALAAGVALILPHCPVCSTFLTPELTDKLAAGIVALGIKLIHSLDQRDVAAPGEMAPGAAVPKEYVDVRALMGDK